MMTNGDDSRVVKADSSAGTTSAPEWLQDFAHELRTPLGGVLAMADLLAKRLAASEDRALLEALQASAEHIRRLASAVIDRGNDTAQIHQYNAEPVECGFWLAPMVESFSARAHRAGVRFALEAEPALPTRIDIDPLRVRQMLENIVDNAMKVMTAGTVFLHITRIDMTTLRFAIRDQGPGFPPQAIANLFGRGMQSATAPKGAGIGLSLVKRYAETAGGRAGAHNLETGGAEVWFELPCLKQPVMSASHSLLQRDWPRALVVEDSHAGRLLMKTMLEHLGFAVETAIGGSMAQEAVRNSPFDLITVDRMLGDTDGVDLVLRLKAALGAQSSTRIVAVTGRIDPADRAAFALSGADGFLPKPVSPRALAELINRLKLARFQRAAGAAA